MAKGQVTEAEIVAGMKSLGGFGALSASKPRRDNPFRDTLSEVVPAKATPAAPPPEPQPAVVVTPATERVPTPDVVPPPQPKVSHAPLSKLIGDSPNAQRADESMERVTLPVSADTRDRLELMAKDLHRSRTKKGERITPNTLIRSAIRMVLDHVELKPGDVANNEDEVLKLLLKRVKR